MRRATRCLIRHFPSYATPGRRNTSYTFTGSTNMMLAPPTGSAQQFYYNGYTIYGATGADGTAVLTLTQAAGPG
ncbi:hypothetical protein MYA98_07840 [Salmonella sp. WGH-01]|nr:hypothetical protein MYA98_07840 [Salmonella sp. WGH-01]